MVKVSKSIFSGIFMPFFYSMAICYLLESLSTCLIRVLLDFSFYISGIRIRFSAGVDVFYTNSVSKFIKASINSRDEPYRFPLISGIILSRTVGVFIPNTFLYCEINDLFRPWVNCRNSTLAIFIIK